MDIIMNIINLVKSNWLEIAGVIIAFETFMLAMQKITAVTPWKWDDNIVAVIINALKAITGFFKKNG